jgi:hypothetical protein
MIADMLALRRVPARFFGVFMSVNPVFAALTGLVVLGQPQQLAGWLAIAAIVTANAVSASAGCGPVRVPVSFRIRSGCIKAASAPLYVGEYSNRDTSAKGVARESPLPGDQPVCRGC